MKSNIFSNHRCYSFALLFCLFIMTNCTSKKKMQTAGVHYKSNNTETITLTSVGFAKDKRNAVFNAEKNAFEVLMFKGVPGSPYAKPLLPSAEQEVKSKNKSYFDDFYGKHSYNDFVTNTNVISPASKDKQTKKMKAVVEITININSLRRDLEQKGVTHKFGL